LTAFNLDVEIVAKPRAKAESEGRGEVTFKPSAATI